jgi:hypothetical protein
MKAKKDIIAKIVKALKDCLTAVVRIELGISNGIQIDKRSIV